MRPGQCCCIFPCRPASWGGGRLISQCLHPQDAAQHESESTETLVCPGCERPIPWHENLPLVSWLLLRGRCSGCGWRIPFRYFLVEGLTASIFVLLWERFGLPLVPAYWVFASLLIVATFIDFEHFTHPR
jgi:prepilin signal peptidase PulO-like enzyme (type II secretory pathway)